MKRRVTTLVLAPLLLGALCAGIVPTRVEAASATLTDPTSGKAVTVEPGPRALHLAFFATWCPTCVDELERLGEIEARWQAQGYRLIVVAVRTRHTADRLADFVETHRPPGRLLFDAEGEAEQAWKAERLPTHVLLDASGRAVARSGALDAAFEAAIAELAGGKKGGGGRR